MTGYAGQLSLCQFALGGFGAWVAARLIVTQGIPFEVGLLAAMAAAIPIGLLVALPALRTRGINLAVATLGLALLIQELILDNSPLTGGFVGTVVPFPRPQHRPGQTRRPLRGAVMGPRGGRARGGASGEGVPGGGCSRCGRTSVPRRLSASRRVRRKLRAARL